MLQKKSYGFSTWLFHTAVNGAVALGALAAAMSHCLAACNPASASTNQDAKLAASLGEIVREASDIVATRRDQLDTLNGDQLMALTTQRVESVDPNFDQLDKNSTQGQTLSILTDSIKNVMATYSRVLQRQSRGFVPVAFDRLVLGEFQMEEQRKNADIDIEFVAPRDQRMSTLAAPKDSQDDDIIDNDLQHFAGPDSRCYAQLPAKPDAPLRVFVPQYYVSDCLSCHVPNGSKGPYGKLQASTQVGQLGGVFIITLLK